MARWLVKEEPSHYSFHDLLHDGQTAWTGVHNPLAQRHLRSMRPGDLVLFYHSGSERAIVGIAKVLSSPRPDPDDARGAPMVDLAPVRTLARPVSLADIRAHSRLADMPLVRISRLSVMPVTAREWAVIASLSGTPEGRRAASPRRRRSPTAR